MAEIVHLVPLTLQLVLRLPNDRIYRRDMAAHSVASTVAIPSTFWGAASHGGPSTGGPAAAAAGGGLSVGGMGMGRGRGRGSVDDLDSSASAVVPAFGGGDLATFASRVAPGGGLSVPHPPTGATQRGSDVAPAATVADEGAE